MSATDSAFAALNQACLRAFGQVVTYYSNSSYATVGQSFTLTAIPVTPTEPDEIQLGIWKYFWIDGSDPTLPVAPAEGDLIVTADGANYVVNRRAVDAENGVFLRCRRMD